MDHALDGDSLDQPLNRELNSDNDDSLLEDVYQYVTNNQYRDGITINQKHFMRNHVSDGEMIIRCGKFEIKRSNLELFKHAT